MRNIIIILSCMLCIRGLAQSSTELFNDGLQQLNDAKYDAAVSSFTKGIKKADNNTEQLTVARLYFARSIAYMSQDNTDAAMADINKAIELKPSHSEFYPVRYTLYLKQKNYSKALEDADTLLSSKPNDLKALAMIGRAYSKMKNHDAARNIYRKMMALNPGDVSNYSYCADEYRIEKKYDLAVHLIDSALKIEPSNGILYVARGSIKAHMKDYEGSEKDFYKSVELDSKLKEISYNNMAYIIDKEKKDWAKMVEHCNKALEDSPNEAYPKCNRGYAKLMLGQLEEGKKDIEEGLQLDPTDSYGYYYMAIYYRLSNKPKKSCPLLDKAIKTELDEDIVDLAQEEKKNCGCN